MAFASAFDLLRRRRTGLTSPRVLESATRGLQPLAPPNIAPRVSGDTPGFTRLPGGIQPIGGSAITRFRPGTPGLPITPPPPVTLPGPGTPAGPTTPGGFRPLGFDLPGRPPADLPTPDTGGPLQEFGPGNDLRSTQINPFTGERLRGAQQGTDVLFRALTGGPDLTQTALDRLRVFEEESERPFQERLRDVGRRSAALGRIGSGMTETELGRALEERERELSRGRRGLAGELAFAEGAERRANLGAGSAFESQLFGQGQGLRGEARTERAFQEEQARRAQDQEILRRQLEVAYEQYLRQLGLQGAGLFGEQAAAGQEAAAGLIGGAFQGGG